MRIWLLLCLLTFSFSFGQEATPEAIADKAVRDWLAQEPLDPFGLSNISAEELCLNLPLLLQPPPLKVAV